MNVNIKSYVTDKLQTNVKTCNFMNKHDKNLNFCFLTYVKDVKNNLHLISCDYLTL